MEIFKIIASGVLKDAFLQLVTELEDSFLMRTWLMNRALFLIFCFTCGLNLSATDAESNITDDYVEGTDEYILQIGGEEADLRNPARSFRIKDLIVLVDAYAKNQTSTGQFVSEVFTLSLQGLAVAGIIAGSVQLRLYCPDSATENFCRNGFYYLWTGVGSFVVHRVPRLINSFYEKKVLDKWQDYVNTSIKNHNTRNVTDSLSHQDVITFGEFIIKAPVNDPRSKKLFKKFNSEQALAIARVNLPAFRSITDRKWFRKDVNSDAVKPLCTMLSLDEEKLTVYLNKKDVKKRFKKIPILLQVLIQTLAKRTMEQEAVKSALIARITHILGEHDQDEAWKTIDAIAQGASIYDYLYDDERTR